MWPVLCSAERWKLRCADVEACRERELQQKAVELRFKEAENDVLLDQYESKCQYADSTINELRTRLQAAHDTKEMVLTQLQELERQSRDREAHGAKAVQSAREEADRTKAALRQTQASAAARESDLANTVARQEEQLQQKQKQIAEAEAAVRASEAALAASKLRLQLSAEEVAQSRDQMLHQKEIAFQYQQINAQMQLENGRCVEQLQVLNDTLALERHEKV
jgi:hypothetical protein